MQKYVTKEDIINKGISIGSIIYMCILYGLRHERPDSNVCFPKQLHTVDQLSFLLSELVLSL